MTIEFFAKLSTGAAARTQPAEDGTRNCAERDAKRAGNSADSNLACCQSSARTTSCSADGSNSCANLHGCL